ncbi:MAG: lipoprotein-releasing ABC transporter permease subunit [Holosporales bacterium]|jgi:lipoprotein-releasing system permease protein|nr:lipoprotein-releasing ABC transporter permease subunit [Holosporales bacterium]
MIERFIARRYLTAREGAGFAYIVTWFSFVGIALGVATLIIVTSVMNGFRAELLDKIVGMKGHVIAMSSKSIGIINHKSIVKKIKESDANVLNVVPQIEQQAVLMTNGSARGIMVHGISENTLRSKKLIADNIKYGSLRGFHGQRILIGKRLSESIHAITGDKIKLYIPDGVITPFGNLPKEEVFEVAGVFEVGMNEYDKNIVMIPLEEAQSFFNLPNMINQIEVFVRDTDAATQIATCISRVLGSDFLVLDWRHSDASIFHAVVVEKNVMTLILSIIILVAIFNIISGLTMLTSSKTKDIAVLRTMGITKNSVLRIFFYIGSAIGIVGTATGLTLGLLVSLNIDRIKSFLESLSGSSLFSEEIYYLSQIPSKINWIEVGCIVASSLILCFLATIYPSHRAAKLDPVDALRI